MELEIEDKLQEIYKNLKIEYQGIQYESKIEYKYDASLTINANLSTIVHIIDTQIILPFFKRGE